jgi:flagellar hook-associated protein 3 FlgL
MRVSNKMLSDTLLAHLRDNLEKLNELQYKLSSAKRFRYSSEDPVATVEIMDIGTYLTENNQFERNIDDALTWLHTTGEKLSQMEDILQRARVLAVQGANETYNAEDRMKMAHEVNQLLESAVSVANANIKFGDRYLFAGADVLTEPFQATRTDGRITDVTYHGDTNKFYREISRDVKVDVNTIGDEVFSGVKHMVMMASGAITGAYTPDTSLDVIYNTGAGVFKINGEEVFYDETDSLKDIRDKINATDTGVTADIIDANGEVISETPPYGSSPFRLRLWTAEPGELWLEDMGEGTLLQELDLIRDASYSPPNNIDPAIPNVKEQKDPPASPTTIPSQRKVTLFEALIGLRDALEIEDKDEAHKEIEDGLTEIDWCLQNLLVHQSKVGAKINRLEWARERLRDQRVHAQELLNKTQGADMEKAIVDLIIQETIHRAALSAGARILQQSLMEFL